MEKNVKKFKEKVFKLSDEQLNEVAGGYTHCMDAGCVYRDNRCVCPDDDDE